MRALSREAAAAVEMHLLVCETCRERLTETDVYLRAIKTAVKNYPLRAAKETRRALPKIAVAKR
jgi:hypothetical protein